MATQGTGFGPRRHEGTSPLPAHTLLAQPFSPPQKKMRGTEGKGREGKGLRVVQTGTTLYGRA